MSCANSSAVSCIVGGSGCPSALLSCVFWLFVVISGLHHPHPTPCPSPFLGVPSTITEHYWSRAAALPAARAVCFVCLWAYICALACESSSSSEQGRAA